MRIKQTFDGRAADINFSKPVHRGVLLMHKTKYAVTGEQEINTNCAKYASRRF